MAGYSYTPTVIAGNTAVGASVYGETAVSQFNPFVQFHAKSTLLPPRVMTAAANGTAAAATSNGDNFSATSGTDVDGHAILHSTRELNYRPGTGAEGRMSGWFTSPSADSSSYLGLFVPEAGFGFGYNGADFGIWIRDEGVRTIVQLTVTVAELTGGTIVISLPRSDGTLEAHTVTISVTTANLELGASEIASLSAFNTGSLADGEYKAIARGDSVYFIAERCYAGTDTPSVVQGTATDFAATMTTRTVGQAPTETHVPQSSWNCDVMDGSGASGMTLNPLLGNVYRIQYQWLGVGNAMFDVINSTTGRFQRVHDYRHANTNASLSISEPQLTIWYEAKNSATGTTSTSVNSGSMALGHQGLITEKQLVNDRIVTTTNVNNGSYAPMLSIRCDSFTGTGASVRHNYGEIKLVRADFSIDSNQGMTVQVLLNADLSAFATTDYPDWTQHSATSSIASYDVTSETVSGGTLLASYFLAKDTSFSASFLDFDIVLEPGDVVTLAVNPDNGTNTVGVNASWSELF